MDFDPVDRGVDLCGVPWKDLGAPKETTYSAFHTQLEQGLIKSMILKDDGTLIATLKDNVPNEPTSTNGGRQLVTHVPGTAMDGYLWNLLSKEAEKYDADFDSKTTNNVFFSIVITIPAVSADFSGDLVLLPAADSVGRAAGSGCWAISGAAGIGCCRRSIRM